MLCCPVLYRLVAIKNNKDIYILCCENLVDFSALESIYI